MLRLLYRLFWSLFFGLIITVWIVQNNSQIEQLITHKLITLLEKEWNVSIATQSARVNFFTCSLFLHNGKVVDNDDRRCHWSFEKAKVHVSPLAYLLKKKVYLYVTINNVTVSMAFANGQLNVIDHIKKIASSRSPDVPISVRLVRLNNFDIGLDYAKLPVRLLLSGYFELTKEKQDGDKHKGMQGIIGIENLDAFVHKKPFFQKMHGKGSLIRDPRSNEWVFTLDQQLSNPAFDPVHEYQLHGVWSADKREFELKEKSGSGGQLSCAFLPKDMVKVQGKIPAHLALNLGNFFSRVHEPQPVTPTSAQDLGGWCSLNGTICTSAPLTGSSGTLALDDFVYQGFPIKHVALTLARVSGANLQAQIVLEQADRRLFEGVVAWDVKDKCGRLTLINPQSIKPFEGAIKHSPHLCWVIKPRHLFVTAEFGKEGALTGRYKLVMLNQSTNNYLAFRGNYNVDHDEVSTEGRTPSGDYRMVIPYRSGAYLKQLEYVVQGHKCIDLQVKDQERRVLAGSIQFSLIRSFFEQGARRLVLGNKAALDVSLDQHDFSHASGSITLREGKIYVPESRNLIERLGASFELDVPNKFFALNDAYLDFSKGRIVCNKASVRLDDSYGIKMIHVPLVIDDLFMNWKRDFYGVVYGSLLVNKLPDSDLNLSGTVVLKKSLLKDNIFSQGSDVLFAGSLGSLIPINQRLKVDVHVLSEQPIRARTDALETYASVDVRVRYAQGQDIAQFPRLTGTINLENGHLKFLRNKLNIEYGKIQFVTNQLNDPMIDLIARNRINKYVVTLQATGSLQKPTIMLESNPELTEEQIVGLLLAGSEDAKLQTDLFAMLQQNLHDIVLGSRDTLPKATGFLETLAKPFQYVQITPDFTDQSGRGGVKGTVSVNVNDQVHAQIQKNFNLQEDFSAQVEYFLADDVSVKAVKDQRGELGAEVEVRLKL